MLVASGFGFFCSPKQGLMRLLSLAIVGMCMSLQSCSEAQDGTGGVRSLDEGGESSAASNSESMQVAFESQRAEVESSQTVVESSGFVFFAVTVESPASAAPEDMSREMQMRLLNEMMTVLDGHAAKVCESKGLTLNDGGKRFSFSRTTLDVRRDGGSVTHTYGVPAVEFNDAMLQNCLPRSSSSP